MQFDRGQLAALAAILRLGSFEAAAGALGITQSAVSQRLKALEEQVGAVLVRRESPARGTEAGRRLAAHAEAVGLLEAQALRDLGAADDGRGPARLKVAVNADSLATWFLSALAPVEDMLFDIVVDDEAHSAGWLRRGEVVAAVTDRAAPVQGCDVLPLGALRYVATASPAYMARWFAEGVTPETVARAPMLRFDGKDDLQAEWIAAHLGKGIAEPPSHTLPSAQGFVEATRRGIGWGMNPAPMVAWLLRRKRLVPLLPEATLDKALYWQSSRMLAPVLAPLTAAVRKAARETLIQT
jgi:LysR family transcriptional regulator (chromosome initiation inhibitor)